MSTQTLSPDVPADPHSARSVRYLNPAAFYTIALAVIALDQAVKAWVRAALPVGQTVPLIPGVFQFTHAQNKGMAFSLLEGKIGLLVLAALLVSAGIIVAQVRTGRTMPRLAGVALALPLGGAIGNLIDRVWQGYVTDFLDFRLINFPIFNVADSAITIGILLLIFRTLTTSDTPPASAAAPSNASNGDERNA